MPQAGEFSDSEIVVMLGENGTGKTTFIRLLAGLIKPDDDGEGVPELNVRSVDDMLYAVAVCGLDLFSNTFLFENIIILMHLTFLLVFFLCLCLFTSPSLILPLLPPVSPSQ